MSRGGFETRPYCNELSLYSLPRSVLSEQGVEIGFIFRRITGG
jgi:hypothetical protein